MSRDPSFFVNSGPNYVAFYTTGLLPKSIHPFNLKLNSQFDNVLKDTHIAHDTSHSDDERMRVEVRAVTAEW